jgi:hypothetical protein
MLGLVTYLCAPLGLYVLPVLTGDFKRAPAASLGRFRHRIDGAPAKPLATALLETRNREPSSRSRD